MTMRFTTLQQCRKAALLFTLCLPSAHLFCPAVLEAREQGSTSQVTVALKKSESLLVEFFNSVAASRRSPGEESTRKARDAAAQVSEVAALLQKHLVAHKDSAEASVLRERVDALGEYLKMEKPPDERDLFQYAEVEKPAAVTHKPAPEVTDDALRAIVSGTVRVRVVLAADGSVKHAVPVVSLDNGLTERAMKAVRGVRFKPAMRKGRAVSQIAQFEYNFNL